MGTRCRLPSRCLWCWGQSHCRGDFCALTTSSVTSGRHFSSTLLTVVLREAPSPSISRQILWGYLQNTFRSLMTRVHVSSVTSVKEMFLSPPYSWNN